MSVKLPEYASNYDDVGWTQISEIAVQNRRRKESMKADRPSPNQSTIKEFQEEKNMERPPAISKFQPFNKGGGQQWNPANAPVQGNNKQTRGTQMTTTPTQPLQSLKPTQPSVGVTPIGNDKGPSKMAKDNVANYVNRKVQANFNTGPNGTNNMTGLSNKTSMYDTGLLSNVAATTKASVASKQDITSGLSGKSHNPYSGNVSVYNLEKPQKSAVASFFGLESEGHVGSGIDANAMFQDDSYKKSKPTEVMQCMTQGAPISGSLAEPDQKKKNLYIESENNLKSKSKK